MKETLGQHMDKSEGVFLTAGMALYFSGFRNAAQLAIVYKALWYLTVKSDQNAGQEYATLKTDFDGLVWRKTTYNQIAEHCFGWVSERTLERIVPSLIKSGHIYRKETTELGIRHYWYAVNLDVTN